MKTISVTIGPGAERHATFELTTQEITDACAEYVLRQESRYDNSSAEVSLECDPVARNFRARVTVKEAL